MDKKPLYSLKELYFRDEVSTLYTKLHQYLTADDPSGKININFASESVLKAYLPELEACLPTILNRRNSTPFRNVSDLKNLGCIVEEEYIEILPFITTASDFFKVEIEVQMGDRVRYATAILERAAPEKVQVKKYFEGRGFYD